MPTCFFSGNVFYTWIRFETHRIVRMKAWNGFNLVTLLKYTIDYFLIQIKAPLIQTSHIILGFIMKIAGSTFFKFCWSISIIIFTKNGVKNEELWVWWGGLSYWRSWAVEWIGVTYYFAYWLQTCAHERLTVRLGCTWLWEVCLFKMSWKQQYELVMFIL